MPLLWGYFGEGRVLTTCATTVIIVITNGATIVITVITNLPEM
jgi:hypothetical protein